MAMDCLLSAMLAIAFVGGCKILYLASQSSSSSGEGCVSRHSRFPLAPSFWTGSNSYDPPVMATNSIFTISGKTCSLVSRTSSTATTTASSDIVALTATSAAAGSQTSASTQGGTTAQAQPQSGALTSDGASATAAGSLASTTLANEGSTSAPTASSSGNQNQGHESSTGASKVSAGTVVGVVFTILIVAGITAGVWLFLRRRRRMKDGKGSNEKSRNGAQDTADTGEGDDSSLLESVPRQLRRFKSLVVERVGGYFEDLKNEPNPAARKRISPPQPLTQEGNSPITRKSWGIRASTFAARLRGIRPPTKGSVDEKDIFSKVTGIGGRLFVDNPNPPPPKDLENPFRDPEVPQLPPLPPASKPWISATPTTLPDGPDSQRSSTDPRASRQRSMSITIGIGEALSSMIPPANAFTPTQDTTQVQAPTKRQSHRRRSTDSSTLYTSFSNRGPSFYPPASGPLPTFDDIQSTNPFADPPPVPTVPPIATWRQSDPEGRRDWLVNPNHNSAQSGSSSSVVILPSIDATIHGSGIGRERDGNDERGRSRLSESLGRYRGNSGGGGGTSRSREPSQIRATASSSSFANPRVSGNRVPNFSRDTLAWKFPSRTPSGMGYMFSGRQASRDTTYTAKSDPFDLER